jgi:hypothetical protein
VLTLRVTGDLRMSYGRFTDDLRAICGLHKALRATQSLVGYTKPYRLHKALPQSLVGYIKPCYKALWAVQSLAGCVKPYGLNHRLFDITPFLSRLNGLMNL